MIKHRETFIFTIGILAVYGKTKIFSDEFER
jgi:hypothetical protein